MQRIISFLLLILVLCSIVCKADVESQSEESTFAESKEKQECNSLIEMAQQGDAESQFAMGMRCSYGLGVPQDYKKAFEWFKKAAQQSYPEAQYNLGVMYYKGEGVMQDYKKAAEWFTKAAQQGFASAQYNLGKMYHQGIGVPQDYNKAVECYTKAAQESYAKAQRILGLMYRVGAGVAQDDKKAVEWLRKAAKQGDAEAQYQLGLMYRVGAGVAQDYKRAVEWYTKAAQQGDADAQYQLASMYDFGYGVTQDYNKAVGWYTKAAQQGVVEAQAKLAAMYHEGKGVAQDDKKAVKWLRKAAKQGNADAQFLLGTSLSLGQGVIEDYVEAYKWVLLAGKNGYDYSEVSKVRDALQRIMTSAQIAQAQQLAKEFVPKKQTLTESHETVNLKPMSNGTGFYVSPNGYVVTAAHVVANAKRIELFNQNINTSAKLVYKDEAIDVAVLKADKANACFLPIISSSEIKTGDEVFTLGFPQIQTQGYEPKYTEGSINALSGMGGNRKFFQISIPVQPGNSGGPMLNSKGRVVGVIAARLDEIATLESTGSIPQNVNYAIKSSFVLPFLDTLSDFEPHKKEMPNKRTELITEAKNAVVLVICY